MSDLPPDFQLDPLTIAFGALMQHVTALVPHERHSEIEPFKAALSGFIVEFIGKSTSLQAGVLNHLYERVEAHEERIEALEQKCDGDG